MRRHNLRDHAARRRMCALREAAAEKYRPRRIQLLLVAETPPAAEDRYFYFEDVTSHDGLFREVAGVLLGEKPDRSMKAQALAELRDRGVFLIDLKLDPLDTSRLETHVPCLVSRCRLLNPDRIILIKVTVFDVAYERLNASGLPVVKERVHFPSSGRQAEFRRQFRKALKLSVKCG